MIIIAQNAARLEDDTYTGLVVTKADRAELEQSGAAHVATLIAQRGGAVPRSRVIQDPHYSIDLVPQADLDIKDKMQALRSPWIGEDGIFETHGRGDELGVDSFAVQCPACFQWSINPRRRAQRRGGGFEPKVCPHCSNEFTVEEAIERQNLTEPGPALTPRSDTADLYTGEQVNRYWLDEPSTINLGVPGIQYKDAELFRGPKILIRQTSVGVYASLDTSDRRCLQSVYVYKTPQDSRVRPEYYLAQLKSRAMLFYFFIDTNQIEWQSYPKLTHRSLQRFPLHAPDLANGAEKERHDALVACVEERLQLAARDHSFLTRAAIDLDYMIEGHVMDIFNLTPSERTRINTRLRPEQNIRIIREMYPPSDSLTH